MRFALFLAPLLLGAAPIAPRAGVVRVRLQTAAGPILLALDARHAPLTVANFLQYVDDGRFDGTSFYRTARRQSRPGGFIQGGIDTDPRRVLPPLPLEPTSRTGLHHLDGAISMARYEQPNSATGNFSIMVGPNPWMDARPGAPGYAVFGRVAGGMDTVKRILVLPSGGGEGPTRGQIITRPVRILHADRLDGTPHPSGRPKPWTLGL